MAIHGLMPGARSFGSALLQETGCPIDEGNRFARLPRRGRKKRTTRRDKHAIPAPDLVNRDFCATAPDRIWTADITYVHTQEGSLYLAFILDVYSRKVVGWSMATHLRTELVVDALEMALWRRNPEVGLIHHTDRGAQHSIRPSHSARGLGVGIVASMGRTGSALDERHLRSLCGEFEVRASSPASLRQPGGYQDGRLRLRGRILQPGSTSLVIRLSEPG